MTNLYYYLTLLTLEKITKLNFMIHDPSLKNLDRQLSAVKGLNSKTKPHFLKNEWKYVALGAELVSGCLVGSGIGYGIDHYFNTAPVGFIALFLLGSSAGLLNVYRFLLATSSQQKVKARHE